MNQEYDLAEERKVFTPAHLDDFVNVMCVLCTTMPSYENGLVSILRWLCHTVNRSEESCCEINHLL